MAEYVFGGPITPVWSHQGQELHAYLWEWIDSGKISAGDSVTVPTLRDLSSHPWDSNDTLRELVMRARLIAKSGIALTVQECGQQPLTPAQWAVLKACATFDSGAEARARAAEQRAEREIAAARKEAEAFAKARIRAAGDFSEILEAMAWGAVGEAKDPHNLFGAKVKSELERRNWSQALLAQRAGVQESDVSRLIRHGVASEPMREKIRTVLWSVTEQQTGDDTK